MKKQFELNRQRLKIIPLNLKQLIICKESFIELEKVVGLEINEPVKFDVVVDNEIKDAWNQWFERVKKNPDNYFWFTRLEIILKVENRIIGSIGFSGLPKESGETEVDYMINPLYQNKDYEPEAFKEMIAFKNKNVKAVFAETPKDYIASQRVLIKNNFVKIEEREKTFLWKLEVP